MCGIAGIYHIKTLEPVREDLLKAMTDALVHRGPDDEGFYCSGPIGLGHRRLSIIDLADGHQPMTNEDRTVWVVFNGEIYNFTDLHGFLKSKGHRFQTRSDTEVIVHLYEEMGESCFGELRGMDWLPNEDAILFFARDILPRIRQRIPEVKLTVVGRNPSRALLNEVKKYPEIELTGWVNDVRPFIARHSLYVIPLRIGGGTRIKVYEAMAMGKAVISTSVGVEGLPVRDGKHVLIADDPEHFAKQIVRLLNDVNGRKKLENSAKNYVRNFKWENIAQAFSNICYDVAASSRASKCRQ